MLYVVPNHDHPTRPGTLHMVNKVYDHEGYDRQLRDFGYKTFAKIPNAPALLSPDHWHMIRDEVFERPMMDLTINKTAFKIGDNDAVVIIGAPKNTTVTISVSGTSVWNETLPDGELEFCAPVPGVYRISLKRWPYKDMYVEVEAVA